MARMANAVIGKKNETWCEGFMLAATLSGRRAVRSNAACRLAAFARARVPRARARPCVGLPPVAFAGRKSMLAACAA